MIRIVVLLFKELIAPLIILSLPVIGFVAVFFSGYMEYKVLQAFFGIQPSENKLLTSLPLAIVLVLEGFKLLWHYLSANSTDENLLNTKIIKLSRIALIIISIVCSFAYVANELYKNVSDTRENFKSNAISELESQRDTAIQKIKNEKVKSEEKIESDLVDLTKEVESKEKDYNDAQARLGDFYKKDKEINKWPATHKALIEGVEVTKNDLDEARGRKNEKKEILITKIENDEKEEIDLTIADYQTKLQKLQDGFKDSGELAIAGHNEFLKTVFTFLAHMVGADRYPSSFYFLSILVFAIALALLLEVMVYFAMRVLSFPENILYKIFNYTGKENPRFKSLVSVCIGVMFSFAALIVWHLWFGLELQSKDFINIIICFVITRFVFSTFSREPAASDGSVQNDDHTNVQQNENSKARLQSVAKMFKKEIAEAVTALSIFCIISMLAGHTLETMAGITISVGLGSLGGGILRNTLGVKITTPPV